MNIFAKQNILKKENILGFLLCSTLICVLGDLAFSVRTYHDIVLFFILVIYFIYCVVSDNIKEKGTILKRLREIFYSSKWLLIAVGAYLIWDIITIIYAKNYIHALKKLPYMLEYLSILVIGVYYCSTKKRLMWVMSSIALTGTLVSIGSYLYYFLNRNPIYFQRLSTARDYNVFACLILICFIFSVVLIMNCLKTSFVKKLLIFTLATAINMPAFYFAGSRRMFIMLPYFFAFAILFDLIHSFILVKKTECSKLSVLKNIVFLGIVALAYFICVSILPSFTQFGTQKEADYKAWVEEQKLIGNEIKKEPNSWNETTISNVIETIEDKSMYSKRSLIYSVAFQELGTYSTIDWIIGRGAAYDIHLYDITDNKELLEAYSITDKTPRPNGWLSVHNFTLADILNGGIIKLLLGLFLVAEIIINIISAVKKQGRFGLALIIPFALVITNNFISGAYGMLNDVFFSTMMIVLISVLFISKNKFINSGEICYDKKVIKKGGHVDGE